jgi:hypothetical protein
METNKEIKQVQPPRLIQTLAEGFNLIANNIKLILYPIIIDILIWFGPHLRVKNLLQPFVNEMSQSLVSFSKPDMETLLTAIQAMWQSTLEHFNLVSAVRSYPIGIPSLFAAQGALNTPLGEVKIYELPSFTNVVLFWLLFSLIGIFLGTLYFYEIARITDKNSPPFSLNTIIQNFAQILLLTFFLIILLLVISIPTSILLTIAATINPFLAQIAMLVITFMVIWLLFPLFFSPHGIFVFRQNVLTAIFNSMRLVRFFLPGTGLLIMVILLISQGLNMLWRLAPETSWMAMVGIIGHAFTATSLLAATFIYFRGGINWMEDNLKRIAAAQQSKSNNI